MLKKFGKYIICKISGSVIGKVIKWGFWPTVVIIGPTTIGIPGIAVAALVVHSGIVEYTATKAIDYKIGKYENS